MDLIVNPLAELRLVDPDDSQGPISVRAPVPGRGLKVTRVERAADPGIFSALLLHRLIPERGLATDLTATERERLEAIGFLVRPDRVPRRVSFACDLDAPERGRRPEPGTQALIARDLVVNPTIEHLGTSGPTRESRGRVKLPDPFEPGRAWLSVAEDRASVRSFFSWSPSTSPDLSVLRAGAPVPAAFDEGWRARLVDAGIASPPSVMAARESRRADAIAVLTARLTRERFLLVPRPMHPWVVASVRRYYRGLIDEGHVVFGDKEWPNRYFGRYDPIAHFFHEQWTALASEIAGEPLKASFPFFAEYHPGSDLPAHRDREQCEISISVQIDHDPEPADLAPWPIYLQPAGPETNLPVRLRLGDAVMFYGREVRHYREALTTGSSSFWFLFYVPEGFEGSLD